MKAAIRCHMALLSVKAEALQHFWRDRKGTGAIEFAIIAPLLIMAYIDGELNEAGRRHVEGLLEASAAAREIAEMMRLSCALVRSAYPQ